MVTSASTTDDSRTLAQTTRALADPRVDDLAAGPDARVAPDGRCCPRSTTPGSMVDVLGDRDAGVDEGAGRIDDRDPRAHVPLVDAQAHLDLGVGQLDAVVDAEEGAVVVDLEAVATGRSSARARGTSSGR